MFRITHSTSNGFPVDPRVLFVFTLITCMLLSAGIFPGAAAAEGANPVKGVNCFYGAEPFLFVRIEVEPFRPLLKNSDIVPPPVRAALNPQFAVLDRAKRLYMIGTAAESSLAAMYYLAEMPDTEFDPFSVNAPGCTSEKMNLPGVRGVIFKGPLPVTMSLAAIEGTPWVLIGNSPAIDLALEGWNSKEAPREIPFQKMIDREEDADLLVSVNAGTRAIELLQSLPPLQAMKLGHDWPSGVMVVKKKQLRAAIQFSDPEKVSKLVADFQKDAESSRKHSPGSLAELRKGAASNPALQGPLVITELMSAWFNEAELQARGKTLMIKLDHPVPILGWLAELLSGFRPAATQGAPASSEYFNEQRKKAMARACISNQRVMEGAVDLWSIENPGEQEEFREFTVAQLKDLGLLKTELKCPANGEYKAAWYKKRALTLCSVHETQEKAYQSATGKGPDYAQCEQIASIMPIGYRIRAEKKGLGSPREAFIPIPELIAEGTMKSMLDCPSGGKYTVELAEDALNVTCSKHGLHKLPF